MKRKTSWLHTDNLALFFGLRLLWALLALLAAQLLFYLFNIRIFGAVGFRQVLAILLGNLRFGFATVALFMLPYLLILPFRRRKPLPLWADLLLLLPMVVALGVNVADWAYFQFTYRRISSDILPYLTIGGDMGNLLPLFLRDYWPVVVSGIALLALFVWISLKTKLLPYRQTRQHWSNRAAGSATVVLVLILSLHGGFHLHALQLSDAARYCYMKNTPLVVNSAYTIARTFPLPKLDDTQYMSDADAEAVIDLHFSTMNYGAPADTTVAAAYPNVVVLVLESFSQEYMGCYNGGREESFTPFLDSLAAIGHAYNGRSNGKKSIEALPSVFSSIPTFSETPFILSSYFNNDFGGLPASLARNGYHTAFFHGSYNGSMDFDKYCAKAGFQHYFGKDEYVAKHGDADADPAWGIFDEPFLQYSLEEISQFPEPFLAGFFTISSHHPYAIPESHKGEFKQGRHPLLQCVMYSDYALRRFFEEASRQPWYNNTLFVITADHPGQGLTPEYNGYDGWYRIPMIFFAPGERGGADSAATRPVHRLPFPDCKRIVQQTDIMPSVLDYTGVRERCLCFGTSLFAQPQRGWQLVYGQGYYSMVTQSADSRELLRTAAFCGSGASFGDEEDLRLMQAVVQQYGKLMRENRLQEK